MDENLVEPALGVDVTAAASAVQVAAVAGTTRQPAHERWAGRVAALLER